MHSCCGICEESIMNKNSADSYGDASDVSVDYSKKYMERNALQNRQNHHLADGSQSEGRSNKKEYRDCESKVDLFGDYAETDLDQPTDYSLRYAEDDTDEDEKQSREYFPNVMQEEDTVKTYCTEGTPYETPFNFSTATSMSDLRVEDIKDSELMKKPQKKVINDVQRELAPFKQKPEQGCDDRQTQMGKKLENVKSPSTNSNSEQPVSEKALNYYEQETPDGFSRVNSLSSLNSAVTTPSTNNVTERMAEVSLADTPTKSDTERSDRNVSRLNSNESTMPSESNSPSDGKSNSRVVDKEGKVVTFCGHDYYAEQTPLMFSRCSSLGSLSGFEQHSIHDDRSSIVSDFSRRTSGVVSPSELPDSPTQTIPPSPRNQKTQATDFVSKMTEEAVRPPVRRLLYVKPQVTKSSVFEDDIATFKEESTPIEFSSATSLSSLTIDDEVKIPDFSKNEKRSEEVRDDDHQAEPKVTLDIKINLVDGEKEQEQVSDGDEDDDDMLAACISMGMQNNRYRQSFKTSNIQKPVPSESSSMRYQRNVALNRLEQHISTHPAEAPSTTIKTGKTSADVVVPDTVHVYCTEDTPADISPVGSQSNLSALSMPSVQEDVEKTERSKPSAAAECHRNDLSDESSNLSGEDEKILDECIQSGMPKVQQITPPPTTCIHFAKKSETLSQKFNICGTPSSSPVECGHSNKSAILNKRPCRKVIEHENSLSDDSPNHSEDEAILSECIQSAIPKVRLSMSPSLCSSSLRSVEASTATTIRKSPSTYSPFRRQYPEQQPEVPVKKPVHFEDNFSLSEEEEDIILAQCIQSGMPKALNVSSSVSAPVMSKTEKCLKAVSIPTIRASEHSEFIAFPAQLSVQGKVPHRPVEGESSGSNSFSLKPIAASSSGHLSKGYESGSFNKMNAASCPRRMQPLSDSRNHGEAFAASSLSRLTKCRSPSFAAGEEDEDDSCRVVDKSVLGPSRHSSVSSLSEEGSLGSIEEWALLEFCITPGMPKHSRYRVPGMKTNENAISHSHEDCEVIPEDNYSVCSYNSYVCKT